jgi:predicted nucleic acid-binding protein
LILVDTNIFLRASDASSVHHPVCVEALTVLGAMGGVAVTCAQVLIEFWVVATRPRDVNGIGMSSADAWNSVNDILRSFPCIDEPPRVIDGWTALISRYQVMGKSAHDARLVAVMKSYDMRRIVTINVADFNRYEGIVTMTPAAVIAAGIP